MTDGGAYLVYSNTNGLLGTSLRVYDDGTVVLTPALNPDGGTTEGNRMGAMHFASRLGEFGEDYGIAHLMD